MIRALVLAGAFTLAAVPQASAWNDIFNSVWGHKSNDTGGIIPWSCETEAMAPAIAADFCARWDKYPRITSVHRQYGDYIAFRCLWSPHVDRFSLPAVPTRNTCLPNRLVTK